MVFTSGSLFPFATRFSFANNQSSCNEETAGVHCTGEVLISLAGVFSVLVSPRTSFPFELSILDPSPTLPTGKNLKKTFDFSFMEKTYRLRGPIWNQLNVLYESLVP